MSQFVVGTYRDNQGRSWLRLIPSPAPPRNPFAARKPAPKASPWRPPQPRQRLSDGAASSTTLTFRPSLLTPLTASLQASRPKISLPSPPPPAPPPPPRLQPAPPQLQPPPPPLFYLGSTTTPVAPPSSHWVFGRDSHAGGQVGKPPMKRPMQAGRSAEQRQVRQTAKQAKVMESKVASSNLNYFIDSNNEDTVPVTA